MKCCPWPDCNLHIINAVNARFRVKFYSIVGEIVKEKIITSEFEWVHSFEFPSLPPLSNSSRSEKNSCFKLLELRVFVFIFLLDDNSVMSARFSSRDLFLFFLLYTKWPCFVLIMNWQP